MTDLPDHEVGRLERVARDESHLADLVRRRRAGEPLQYLEGTAPFGPWDLVVDRRVLIPRPETEGLWELARSVPTAPPLLIVDLCTGSGALAIALQRSFHTARVVGTDISEEALAVAKLNGARLAPGVEWRQGDLFGALEPDMAGRVELLVSNPPYVAASEWPELPPDVRNEPRVALVAGPTGTEVLARIARECAHWLAPGGVLLCEIGESQGDEARRSFERVGVVEVRLDLAGRARYVVVST